MEDMQNELQPQTTENQQEPEQPASAQKPTKKQQFFQFLKFTLFSISAGIIQILSTTILHQWTGWLLNYYWLAYIIGLTLSVIWNFTFNRKFTFKAANNIPLAMALVILYNCIIVVPLALGGDALVALWGDDWGILVTAISLLINFITEFFWDKFVVFNAKVTDRILKLFSKDKEQ
ncbi:MAG: GtrA family protein [Clostridia bacterium]|nr:GtrA family protein [Clostridia bacterium]